MLDFGGLIQKESMNARWFYPPNRKFFPNMKIRL